jgi:hypothetical protein
LNEYKLITKDRTSPQKLGRMLKEIGITSIKNSNNMGYNYRKTAKELYDIFEEKDWIDHEVDVINKQDTEDEDDDDVVVCEDKSIVIRGEDHNEIVNELKKQIEELKKLVVPVVKPVIEIVEPVIEIVEPEVEKKPTKKPKTMKMVIQNEPIKNDEPVLTEDYKINFTFKFNNSSDCMDKNSYYTDDVINNVIKICSKELEKKHSIIEYQTCCVSEKTYTSGFNLIYNDVQINDDTFYKIRYTINEIDIFKNIPYITGFNDIITVDNNQVVEKKPTKKPKTMKMVIQNEPKVKQKKSKSTECETTDDIAKSFLNSF